MGCIKPHYRNILHSLKYGYCNSSRNHLEIPGNRQFCCHSTELQFCYITWLAQCLCHYTHTNTQPFNGPLSGTTQVGQYEKKHSPTHTHLDHQTSFINSLHLSTVFSLFHLRAWQSFSAISRSSLVYVFSGTLYFILHISLHPIIFFSVLQMPTSLARRRWSSPQQCYLHCFHTLLAVLM